MTVQEIHATGIAKRNKYAVWTPGDIFFVVDIFNCVAKSRPTIAIRKVIPWHSIYFSTGKMLTMPRIKKDKLKNPSQEHVEQEIEKAEEAHKQANKDINQDPDLTTMPRPEDNLDEGELARLEGED